MKTMKKIVCALMTLVLLLPVSAWICIPVTAPGLNAGMFSEHWSRNSSPNGRS